MPMIPAAHLSLKAFLVGMIGGSFLMNMFMMHGNSVFIGMNMINNNNNNNDMSSSSSPSMLRARPTSESASHDKEQDDKQHIFLRPFLDPPELHNVSVSGDALPGPFYNNKLFLLGARLTTSYEENDSSVSVDLFGFPGDWFTRKMRDFDEYSMCPGKNPFNSTLLHYPQLQQNNTLYCQLECGDNGECAGAHTKSKMIPMELVPLLSGDPNQEETTLIWRCNVGELVNKNDLVEAATQDEQQALRVKFWISHNNHATTEPAQQQQQRQVTKYNAITSVDIPLKTAVVGYGGPQVRGDHGYFTQRKFQVGLTVATYGLWSQTYLPEFVQHHLNVGFEQIVIGIETTLGSVEMEAAQKLLKRYLDQGTVVLAATGHHQYFRCDNDLEKLHFYHESLYHLKGLSPYAATWDIDEFWLPPDQLPETTTKTTPESFLPVVTNDKLWQDSNYAKTISIGRVMHAIEEYYQKDDGCGGEWCFHLLPSFSVHLLDGKKATGKNRLNRHVYDFGKRDEKYNQVWQKSITRTKNAHMSGMHLPGSCKFESDEKQKYVPFSRNPATCPFRAEPPQVFGRIHHFFQLMTNRNYPLEKTHMGNLPPDEYVTRYGYTVSQQLDAQGFVIKPGSPFH